MSATANPAGHAAGRVRSPRSTPTSGLAGTAELVRFVLRRDRIVLPACVAGIALLLVLSASSVKELYPTPADRAHLAATLGDNPALRALRGQPHAIDTLGGLVSFEMAVAGSLFVALMSLLLVVRHTRAEEERGRTELVRAVAVGRWAPLAAPLAVVIAADLAIGLLSALGMVALGLPVAGSFALGAVYAAAGLVFAATAAVAAQVVESSRGATGIAAAALGASYALRAIGDLGSGALTWFSPLGWGEEVRAYAGDRWWVLLLPLAATVLLVVAAYALLDRRDLGAGLVQPRPGRPRATPRLAGPLALAVRLQRASVLGWTAGLLLLGIAYGAIAHDIGDFIDGNKAIGDLLTREASAGLVDAFLASVLLLLGIVAGGFAVQSTLRAHGEEAAGRAEPLLAAALSRTRWAASHLAVAFAGTAMMVTAAGLGAGLADAVRSGDAAQIPRLAGAGLAQAPAAWVLAGLALTAYGLSARAIAVPWIALTACVLLWFLGPLAHLPGWVTDLSPFTHTPQVPATAVSAGPLVALTAVALALSGLGLLALRRRDLGG